MDQMSASSNYQHQQHQTFNSSDSRHYTNNLYNYYTVASNDLVDSIHLDEQNKDSANVGSQDSMGLTLSTFLTSTASSLSRNAVSPTSAKKQKTHQDAKKLKLNRADLQSSQQNIKNNFDRKEAPEESQMQVQVNSG
jgi:hypothetical protein